MTEGFLGLILGAGVKLILGWIQGMRADAALKQAGAVETANKVNKETADAERRAAAVKPLTREDAAGRLDRGEF